MVWNNHARRFMILKEGKAMTIGQTPLKSAAITGAGSGLGREIALGLAVQGYQVFGTAFSAEEVALLAEESKGAVTLTECDITDEGAVKRWRDAVSEEIDGTLNLLVSNAGILTPGPIEAIPLDAIRREFEVNVFGALAVVNAFLPALRKARGRVVQVSTWTAWLPLPFNGPSGASKAAFEVFADVYRSELQSSGVEFVVAVAGNMKTGGPAKTAANLKEVEDSLTTEQRSLYGDAFATFVASLNRMQASGLDAKAAAARVIELAEQQPAPFHGAVGEDAERVLQLVREKSDAELDVIRRQLAGLNGNDQA